MAELSPMMKQYLSIKEQYPDTLLFFRLGDFYEMFFDDAKTASRELELTLTGRDCGLEERAPMCGVPFHSYEGYVAKLVQKGYKVAICEQMEDPALAKGIVKREIIRVITPGTVLENNMLEEGKNNYLCSLYIRENRCGVCFADISTGSVYATRLLSQNLNELEKDLENELSRFSPKEVVANGEVSSFLNLPKFIREKLSAAFEVLGEENFLLEQCRDRVGRQFPDFRLSGPENEELVCALGAMLSYLSETQRSGLERLSAIELYEDSQFMRIDMNTRRNLELTETMRGKEKRGSLLWVLDHTRTAMGKRLLRTCIEQPLLSLSQISRRHNAVDELYSDTILRDRLFEALGGIFDLERIITRVVYGSANARELRSLADTTRRLPALRACLAGVKTSLLCSLRDSIDELTDVTDLIDRAIVEDPPFIIRDGGMIRKGFSEEFDRLKGDMTNSQELIAAMETYEKERTKIPKLKIGYNRVFGYYIEVSNSYKSQVPEDYIRKQTLVNCERYITPELKELENRILGSGDKALRLELELFDGVRKSVAAEMQRITRTAGAVAMLDVLVSFAGVAVSNRYVRPQMDLSGKIVLKESRHPVVELLLRDALFVPNDVLLDSDENRIAIITGPNMAGKSTYMRQTALILLMAQIGSFVPASYAQLGIVDSIFTRVGASDDLSAGQSTFMVEMSEVADILRNATEKSFIIFDEIGRGTSTFDGMSIARAVLEYVADRKKIGAKTMFATHYHELKELEDTIGGVKNYNIAVKKRGDDITFLRRIVRGGADDSFGIEVAKLAGVPDEVIERAKKILVKLESGEIVSPMTKREIPAKDTAVQLVLSSSDSQIVSKLRNIDVNTLTPIECMTLLFELSKLAKEE